MTRDRDENNRILAEGLLGWLKPKKDETEQCLAERRYELRNWTLHRTSGAPIENFSSYYWTPPDFYTDEAANALLLDHFRLRFPYFSITFNTERSKTEFEASGLSTNRNFCWETPQTDRKAAICEACLKYLASVEGQT